MGEFDELIKMGELVDQIGEDFPSDGDLNNLPKPDAITVEDDDGDVYRMSVQDVEKEDDGAAVMEQEAESSDISLDELLGLKKRQPAREADPEPAQERAGKTAGGDTSDRQPSAIEQRMSEMSDEIRRLKDQNDLLIRRELATHDDQSAGAEQTEELSDDVREYFRKYGLVTKDEVSELQETLKPIREQKQREQLAAFIGNHVEGFRAEHVPALIDAVNSMEGPERSLYEDGVAGAVLLAHNLVSRGALDLGKKKGRVNPLVQRHHSESGGTTANGRDQMDEDAQVRALMAADPEAIRRMVDNLEG